MKRKESLDKNDYISLIALLSIIILTLSTSITTNNPTWSFYGIIGGLLKTIGSVGFPLAIMVIGCIANESEENIRFFYKKILKIFIIPLIIYSIICNLLSNKEYNNLWYTSVFIGIVICSPFLNILLKNISDNLLKILIILIIVSRSCQIYLPLLGINLNWIDLSIFNNFIVFYIIGSYLTRIKYYKTKHIIYKLGIISFIATFILRDVNIDFSIYSVSPTLILYTSAIFLKLNNINWSRIENNKYIYSFIYFITNHKLGIYMLHNYIIINLLQNKFNLHSNRFKVIIGSLLVLIITFILMSIITIVVDKYIIPIIYNIFKYILDKYIFKYKTLTDFKCYLIWILVSLFITILIEVISRGSIEKAILFSSIQSKRFMVNFIIVLTITSISLISKKMYMILTVISEFLIILAIVSFVMTNFRGTPLTYSDFYSIQDGIGIAKQYLNIWMIGVIVFIILLFGIITYRISLYNINNGLINKAMSIVIIITMVILMNSSINNGIRNKILVPNQWDLKLSYDDNGFIYSLYNSYDSYKRKKPELYTKTNLNKIKNNIYSRKSLNQSNETPNIIILQLESVIDPMRIEGVKFSKDPIENIRKASQKYTSGNISVPTFGGGTARTEFEVFTGINMDYLSPGEIPHNSILKKDAIESLAYILDDDKYENTLIHNYEGSFYGRNKAYENLGIQRYIPLEYMYDVEYPYVWPSDNLILNNIKNTLEYTDKRDLIFGLAVQTHGSYSNEYQNADSKVKVTGKYEQNKLNQIQDFIDDLVMVDNMVGNLVEYVENLDEPTILAVYSDHLPSLDLVNENIEEKEKYTTEYFICDNMGLKKEDKNIEAYELSTEILNKINMEGGVMNKFHNAYKNKPDYNKNLELIQYDIISGNKYIYNDKKIYQKTNIKLGIEDISIEDIKLESDKIIVTGKGFNEFSKIYVDDKPIETNYISNRELVGSIDSQKIKKVSVHQISRYQKSIGSSNTYIIDKS